MSDDHKAQFDRLLKELELMQNTAKYHSELLEADILGRAISELNWFESELGFTKMHKDERIKYLEGRVKSLQKKKEGDSR